MNVRKIFKRTKNHFNPAAASVPVAGGYNFVVESALETPKGLGDSVKKFFGFYSKYNPPAKVANDIGLLANAEGVTTGIFDPSSMIENSGFSYAENNFSLRLERNGQLFLKCDTAFAEKVRALPSVSAVKEINKNVAVSAPKTNVPKA